MVNRQLELILVSQASGIVDCLLLYQITFQKLHLIIFLANPHQMYLSPQNYKPKTQFCLETSCQIFDLILKILLLSFQIFFIWEFSFPQVNYFHRTERGKTDNLLFHPLKYSHLYLFKKHFFSNLKAANADFFDFHYLVLLITISA